MSAPPADPSASSPLRGRTWRLAAVAIVLAGAAAATHVLGDPEEPRIRPPTGNILYVDTAGWYERTPDEVAVRSPYLLTLAGLPSGLPFGVGEWRGEDREHDPAVDVWLRHPEVVIERTYRRPEGDLVWVSAFGSRGNKSYHLFEHTPENCYPLGGWLIDDFRVLRLSRGPRPLPVNLGWAHRDGAELVFVHLYVWDSPSRDPERGVLSLRLASPVRLDRQATTALLAEDFLAELFPSTLAWRRF